MELLSTDSWLNIVSIFLGAGGLGYGLVSHLMNRKKYEQEVRDISAEADIKTDEFWKKRYDVLQKEVENKDNWWKDRYDALYKDYKSEKELSNDIVKTFRTELNEMRNDYEKQKELERQKYDKLLEQYKAYEEESKKKEVEYKNRISQLDELIENYERRLNLTKDEE